jgi:hypothetical protein
MTGAAIVRNGIKANKTLDQIQKEGLPSKWLSYSHGYVTTERWLAMLYGGLKK